MQADQEDSNNDETDPNDDLSNFEVPDGGWGWIIVAASLAFNIIYDGCSYSFGILFTKLLDYFGDTKSNTAWIGSLFFSVPLLCGPIAAIVSRKLGYRASTMLGGLIASIGFAIGSFANSVLTLVLSYGLISGLGVSIPYFNSTVIVANYFNKRRALATGIAECGAGAGTLIFAPFVQYLVSDYGWRGAMLILSAVVGNIVVCGALYRPLRRKKVVVTNYVSTELSKMLTEVEKDPQSCNNTTETELELSSNDNTVDQYANTIQNGISKTYPNDKADSVHIELLNKSTLNQNIEVLDTWTFRSYLNDLKQMTSLSFILFLMSNFVMYFWYDVPYVFFVDKTVEDGLTMTKATYLISIIGLVHTLGILAYGAVGDRKFIDSTLLFGVSILLCGVSVLCVPMTRSYPFWIILSVGFGLFSAATEVLVPLILIKIAGLKNLDTAFGIVMFLEGVANLVGPPVAGELIFIFFFL